MMHYYVLIDDEIVGAFEEEKYARDFMNIFDEKKAIKLYYKIEDTMFDIRNIRKEKDD